MAGRAELPGEGAGEIVVATAGGRVGLWGLGNCRAVEDSSNEAKRVLPGA